MTWLRSADELAPRRALPRTAPAAGVLHLVLLLGPRHRRGYAHNPACLAASSCRPLTWRAPVSAGRPPTQPSRLPACACLLPGAGLIKGADVQQLQLAPSHFGELAAKACSTSMDALSEAFPKASRSGGWEDSAGNCWRGCGELPGRGGPVGCTCCGAKLALRLQSVPPYPFIWPSSSCPPMLFAADG